MPEIKGSVDVQRPVEEVFAYLTDPSNNLKWEKGVLEMELTSEGPVGVGSKGRRVENYMGRDEGTYEITEFETNKGFSFRFESEKFAGDGGYSLESAGDGTKLTYRFNAKPKNPIWGLLTPLMMPMVSRQTRKNYSNLKQLLETQG